MAGKTRTEQPSRPNRIRFVMLEADLTDGNFSDLTAAITQALRPNQSQTKTLASVQPAPKVLNGKVGTSEPIEENLDEDVEETETAELESSAEQDTPRTKNPKKYPVPEYKHDLDLTGSGETFKDYAARKAPTSLLQKYLVSAMWLKEFGQSPTIDIHKVYTCFRTAGWSTKINDWDSAFRNLKKVNKIRRTDDGTYAITPIGEDDVK